MVVDLIYYHSLKLCQKNLKRNALVILKIKVEEARAQLFGFKELADVVSHEE